MKLTKKQKEMLQGLGYLGYTGCEFDPKSFKQERIDKIREIIRWFLTKTKNINYKSSTSYGLKHEIEDCCYAKGHPLNEYVSNGECIYAMILEGFDVQRPDGSMNCYFNLSLKSENLLRENTEHYKKRCGY